MRRRQLAFIAVLIFGILIPGYTFLGVNLAGESLARWTVLAIPFICILAFPAVVILRRADRATQSKRTLRIENLVTSLAYSSMGLLSFLLVCTVLRDLVDMTIGVWVGADRIVLLSAAAFVVGSLRARMGPQVVRVRLRYENLPPELNGFCIVQVSDLHMSSTIPASYVEKVVGKVNELSPHMIALTGDIADGFVQDHPDTLAKLGALKATSGVFYVPGNHEYYWNGAEWLQSFRDLGFEVLLNSGKNLIHNNKAVAVGGITDPAGAEMGGAEAPSVASAFQACATADFKILLSHRPSFAQEASVTGFDLQLSGHTHGGQFLPWTLAIYLFHRYAIGTYRIGKMWLHVNAGTGSWGPLLRLGTTPEITRIELV